MKLEDIKKSLRDMEDGELTTLIEGIRASRQENKNAKVDKVQSPRGTNTAQKFKKLMGALTPEQQAELLSEMEVDK